MLINSYRFGVSSIVTSGLIMNLDAGNTSSYSGTGTTWSDISGSGNNATLTNGLSYTSNDGGGLVFNSSVSNQSAATNSLSGASSGLTIEIIARYTLSAGYQYICGRDGFYRVIANTADIQFVLASTTAGWYAANTIAAGPPGASVTSGGICQIACAFNGTQRFLYFNGSLLGQSSMVSSGNIISSGVNYTIGSNVSGLPFFKGTMHINRAYNRALSNAEILQNFQNASARFGI